MAVHKHTDVPSGTNNERPRNEEISWLGLARVVYAWSDKRDSVIDQTWWRTAGGYYQALRAMPQRTEEMPVVAEPSKSMPVAVVPKAESASGSIPQHRIPPWASAFQKGA